MYSPSPFTTLSHRSTSFSITLR